MITLTHTEKKKETNNPFNIVKVCDGGGARVCVLVFCANNRKKYPDEVASKRRVVGSSE